jgi:hypothetical protein
MNRQHRLTQRSIAEHPAVRHLRLPSMIRQTSVVVPPMSKVSIRDVPSWRAMLTDADTPAAGPDIAITSGTPLDRGNRHHGAGRMKHLQARPNRQAPVPARSNIRRQSASPPR